MNLKTLFDHYNPWLDADIMDDTVLIACLGRLTRTVPQHLFPGWSKLEDRVSLLDVLRPAVLAQRGYKSAYHAKMEDLGQHERKLLIERKLMSPSMASRSEGCEIFIPKKQDVSVMLNEEEHLVIHSFAAGLQLETLKTKLEKLASSIEDKCAFAKNAAGDYLCSMPAECGNGLQMYVVLYLPGLVISNLMGEIRTALEQLNLDIAPFYSDGAKDTGDLFVLFMRPTTTQAFQADLAKLQRVANTLETRELQVRRKMLTLRPLEVRDHVSRALGRLLYATVLNFEEMANSLSMLILGTHYGFIEWGCDACIHGELRSLNMLLAPAHLCSSIACRSGEIDARDIKALRASEIQKILSELKPQLLAI